LEEVSKLAVLSNRRAAPEFYALLMQPVTEADVQTPQEVYAELQGASAQMGTRF
jgi:hypothetical protein